MLREVRDALYPRRCLLCGERTGDLDAADTTCNRHRLPRGLSGPRCRRCAIALPRSIPDGELCRVCRHRSPGLRGVAAVGDYREDDGLADWVLALKHGGRRDLARPLGAELAARLQADGRGARWRRVLVPVPLHPVRTMERGFDQAALLARHAASAAGVTSCAALRRRRRTPPQGTIAVASRRANVADAFVLARRFLPTAPVGDRSRATGILAGADVWLVDDVMTSGATLEACAARVRAAGARAVFALVVARAGGVAGSDRSGAGGSDEFDARSARGG